VIVLLLTGVGLGALFWLFPDRIKTGADWTNVLRSLGLLLLVMTSAGVAIRFSPKQALRHAAVWAAILAVIVIGAVYWNDVKAVGLRVRSALVPAYAIDTGQHEMALTQDVQGAYHVIGEVNGHKVDFLVDTGASDVVLSPADAARIGIDTSALRFDRPHETANGIGLGAAFTADSLSVGKIALTDVPVSINKAPMPTSLLGMSFLKRLDSFEFRNGQLILKWNPAALR
jgi:aspartyl protease family protein